MAAEGVPTSYAELLRVIDMLPELVREKRRRDGLSFRAAEREAGVSFNTIRRLEQRTGDLQVASLRILIRWVET
jgi:transcriptional regulator with XRE-family HTH domain